MENRRFGWDEWPGRGMHVQLKSNSMYFTPQRAGCWREKTEIASRIRQQLLYCIDYLLENCSVSKCN